MAKLQIKNPVAQVLIRRSALAPRLPSLNKGRVALYWNGKPGGDIALTHLGELLKARHPDLKLELIRSGTFGTKERVDYAKTFEGVIGGCFD